MSVAALPQKVRLTDTKSKGRRPWFWIAIGVVVVALVLYMMFAASSAGPAITAAQIYEVIPVDLEIKVSKDGEMQAINNIDINCMVEGTTTITSIVKEGTSVKKGDTLFVLDSTQIRQRMEDTSLDLQKAAADLTNAREMLEIQKNTNATNLEGAEVSLTLAQLDLKQYAEGTYPQMLSTAQTDVQMAKIGLANRQEDLDQTKKLYVRGFVTAADVKKAELDVITADNTLDKCVTSVKVLSEYTHEMDQTSKKNSLLQAGARINRTRRENTSNLSWRTADLTSKEQAMNVLKRRDDRLKEQYAACNVVAPADGMVIYGSTTDRNAQTPIQEGAQVRERQLVVRLPDTSAMKAVVRIHEAVVPKLREGQRAMVKIVGIPEQLGATLSKISVLADNSNRWWNPDLREYPIDLTLDKTPANLKPGLGAVSEILVERLSSVTAVPLDAVYTMGSDRYVFALRGQTPEPVKVTVGANNDTHVQVLDGVALGQRVLRLQAGQGRDLLEKAGIKVEPATRPSGKHGPAPVAGSPPTAARP